MMFARCARYIRGTFFILATAVLLFNAWRVLEAILMGKLG